MKDDKAELKRKRSETRAIESMIATMIRNGFSISGRLKSQVCRRQKELS